MIAWRHQASSSCTFIRWLLCDRHSRAGFAVLNVSHCVELGPTLRDLWPAIRDLWPTFIDLWPAVIDLRPSFRDLCPIEGSVTNFERSAMNHWCIFSQSVTNCKVCVALCAIYDSLLGICELLWETCVSRQAVCPTVKDLSRCETLRPALTDLWPTVKDLCSAVNDLCPAVIDWCPTSRDLCPAVRNLSRCIDLFCFGIQVPIQVALGVQISLIKRLQPSIMHYFLFVYGNWFLRQ